jgi:hypothetical protein
MTQPRRTRYRGAAPPSRAPPDSRFLQAVAERLAQDLNLPPAIAAEHVRRLAVSAQPRAVERVDAQKDEQADDTDQHRNCRLISPRLRLCETPLIARPSLRCCLPLTAMLERTPTAQPPAHWRAPGGNRTRRTGRGCFLIRGHSRLVHASPQPSCWNAMAPLCPVYNIRNGNSSRAVGRIGGAQRSAPSAVRPVAFGDPPSPLHDDRPSLAPLEF